MVTNIGNIFMQLKRFNNRIIFSDCYIIHSIIIDKINMYQMNKQNISNNIREIFIKKNYIIFNDNKNIIIGNITKFLFIPKFIISYDSYEIFN